MCVCVCVCVFNIQSIYCVKDNSSYSGHNEKAYISILFDILFCHIYFIFRMLPLNILFDLIFYLKGIVYNLSSLKFICIISTRNIVYNVIGRILI